MRQQREQFVAVGLDEWRMSGVQRDWGAVLTGAAMKPAVGPGRHGALARLHARRGLAVAVVVTGLVIIAAPALAFIAGSAQWPWARDQRGVSLAASVRASGRTATVRLTSRAGLVYRTRGSNPKVLAPVVAKRRLRFAWELRSEGGKVLSAAVVTGAATVRLCAPCASREAGAFTLTGPKALALLNGRAKLRAQIEQRTLFAPIHLRRNG